MMHKHRPYGTEKPAVPLVLPDPGEEDMKAYLRWWSNGQPQSKLPVDCENEAKDAIRQKYPRAVFKWRPVSDTNLAADQHICAWADDEAWRHDISPVADILIAE